MRDEIFLASPLTDRVLRFVLSSSLALSLSRFREMMRKERREERDLFSTSVVSPLLPLPSPSPFSKIRISFRWYRDDECSWLVKGTFGGRPLAGGKQWRSRVKNRSICMESSGPFFDLLVGRGEDSRFGILLRNGRSEDKEADKRGTNLSWSR